MDSHSDLSDVSSPLSSVPSSPPLLPDAEPQQKDEVASVFDRFGDGYVVRVRDVSDCFEVMGKLADPAITSRIRKIHLLLSAAQYDDFMDDALTMLVQAVKQHSTRLDCVRLECVDCYLFTQETFILSTPTYSQWLNDDCHAFFACKMATTRKLPPAAIVTALEKEFIRNLLQLRNVREVDIAGPFHRDLVAKLEANLRAPAGQTPVDPRSDKAGQSYMVGYTDWIALRPMSKLPTGVEDLIESFHAKEVRYEEDKATGLRRLSKEWLKMVPTGRAAQVVLGWYATPHEQSYGFGY